MKHTKLIGLTLMSSAILLQVGYAANVSINHPIVNTGSFDVYFENPVTSEASEQVVVDVSEQGNTLDIKVQNLYPGAEFNIETHIKNNGNISAQVKDIKLQSTNTSKELMDMLVGYGTSGEVYGGEEAYNSYLQKTYQGHQLDKGDSMPLKFKLGMNSEVENLQNETVEFSIQISLEQVIDSGSGDGNEPGGGGSDPDTDIVHPDTDLPEETIPGGEITIPETTIPDITIPEETIPGGTTDIDVTVLDESTPGGPTTKLPGVGMLPKTGGITPSLVYTIGFAMLAGGIVVYRKKDEK